MPRPLRSVLLALMVVVLPAVTLYLISSVVFADGALLAPLRVVAPSAADVAAYLGWVAFQAALMALLPGKTVQGMPLPDGKTLPYRTNGLAALLVTLAVAIGASAAGLVDPAWLFDHVAPLLTAANVLVIAFCALVAVLARHQATEEERRQSGIEKYVLGVARNPRTGSFDWKFFCESRPGMILWLLIDLSAAWAQHARAGQVSTAMWLVVGFQALYIVDYFVVEEAILSTWDIQHEGFGFILGWGCMVWIPFTFSLQAVYLAHHPVDLPAWAVAGIALLNCAGYYIFRSSNLQKNEFRRGRKTEIWGRPAEFIQTRRGTRLLVSGWWGIARHANYLGDLMMGLAWCLATGVDRVVPYFYILYFTILLVHREWRDGRHCARKYGEDWKAYVARVRWRILPGIY